MNHDLRKRAETPRIRVAFASELVKAYGLSGAIKLELDAICDELVRAMSERPEFKPNMYLLEIAAVKAPSQEVG
jgi:hypothetical protein